MQPTTSKRVALVTGGSRGIGAAIAERLSADGLAVAITYARARERAEAVVGAIRARGGEALAIEAEAADTTAVEAAVTTTVRALGRLDVLVNNAGVAKFAPVEEISLTDFDRIMAVNVRAVFVAARAAARHLGDGGRIVNIGSVNADRVPFAGGSVYAASKAAIAGLTRGLARDLGSRGITVNAVQPGPVDTDLNPDQGAFAASLKSLMAIPRYGRAREIASLVAWLTGPEAAFTTGACLTMDGGFLA